MKNMKLHSKIAEMSVCSVYVYEREKKKEKVLVFSWINLSFITKFSCPPDTRFNCHPNIECY